MPRPCWESKPAGRATASDSSRAAGLVNTLIESREERQLKRYLAKLSCLELFIGDEVGYISFSAEGAQLLFQVFSARYEKGSLIVTTNLPLAQWTVCSVTPP